MAQQVINVGTVDGDHTGETTRSGGVKINANFTELYPVLSAILLKADIDSQTLTGTPRAPTANLGTNSTQIATTAFVKASLDALIAGAPGALDTLLEIANQLSTDESAVSALTTTVAGKVPLTRTINSHALSADLTLTKSDLSLGSVDNTADASKPVSTAQATAIALKADIDNPTFTTGTTSPKVAVSGITGSTNQARLVGRTTSGAPTTGAHSIGDICIDASGLIFVCTSAGTPGTWVTYIPIQTAPFNIGTTVNGTQNIDWNNGEMQSLTMTGAAVFTFTAPVGRVGKLTLFATDGSFVATWPTIKWSGAVAGVIPTGTLSIISLIYDGTSYYGAISIPDAR